MYFVNEEMGCDDMPNMASNRDAKDTSEGAAPQLEAEQVQQEEPLKDEQPVQSPLSSEAYDSGFTKEGADEVEPTPRTVSARIEPNQIKK